MAHNNDIASHLVTLQEQAKREVIEYLESKEVFSIADVQYLNTSDFTSLLQGINPEIRRAKVREALKQFIRGDEEKGEWKEINDKLDQLIRVFSNKIKDEESELDDWTHVSSEAPKHWKRELMDFYGIDNQHGKIKCMVLGGYYPKKDVKAAHLSMRHTQGKTLVKLGLEKTDLHNARNGLLLYNTIENQFDVKKVCFLYDPFKRKLFLFVLDPALMEQTVVDDIKFKDIHLKPLLLSKPGAWPYRRVLNAHARASFRNAKIKGWISEDCAVFDYFALSDGVPEHRFPNPSTNIQSAMSLPGIKPTILVDNQRYDVEEYQIANDHEFATVHYKRRNQKKTIYMRLADFDWVKRE